MKIQVTILSAVLSISLIACQQKPAVQANICDAIPTGAWWSDNNFTQERKTEFCLQTWAYRLAPSPDSAETVSDAVMYACRGMVSVTKVEAVTGNKDLIGGDRETANELERDIEKRLHQHALFRVVQARAGKCAVPIHGVSQG